MYNAPTCRNGAAEMWNDCNSPSHLTWKIVYDCSIIILTQSYKILVKGTWWKSPLLPFSKYWNHFNFYKITDLVLRQVIQQIPTRTAFFFFFFCCLFCNSAVVSMRESCKLDTVSTLFWTCEISPLRNKEIFREKKCIASLCLLKLSLPQCKRGRWKKLTVAFQWCFW